MIPNEKSWRKLAARREMRPAWLVLAISVMATFWFWGLAKSYDRRVLESEFDVMMVGFVDRIKQTMTAYEGVLRAGRGFFGAMREVSREEWREFVESLELDRHHPGTRGIGYATMIAPDNLEDHIRKLREVRGPDYNVHPAGQRDQYSAIIYLVPEDYRNYRALGYDMYSEPERRAAMDRARQTNSVASSAKVRLVQELGEDIIQNGFLLYLAVFERISTSQSSQGEAALRGFVYIPIRMKEFVTGVVGTDLAWLLPLMRVEIFDGGHLSQDSLLYDSGAADRSSPPLIQRTTRYQQNGRPWTLRFTSLPAFEQGQTATPALVLAAGGGLSVLLWAIAALIARRQIDESLANARTATLTRELSHRVKNTLAIVQSIANRSLSEGRPVAEARSIFSQRLLALSRAHSLLADTDWSGADLHQLVSAELSSFGSQVELVGPQVWLRPQIAHTFALVLHELAINAAKYGALSVPEGRSILRWSREKSGDVHLFRFSWTEIDGPPCEPPTKTGFGLLLLKQAVNRTVRPPVIEFLPQGMRYELELPFDSVGTLDEIEEAWIGD